MKTRPAPQSLTRKTGALGLSLPKWVWDAAKRPDRSRQGFDLALEDAVALVADYDWLSVDTLCDQIAQLVAERLRADEVFVEFVAVHRKTRAPRIVVQCGRHAGYLEPAVDYTAKPPRIVGGQKH